MMSSDEEEIPDLVAAQVSKVPITIITGFLGKNPVHSSSKTQYGNPKVLTPSPPETDFCLPSPKGANQL